MDRIRSSCAFGLDLALDFPAPALPDEAAACGHGRATIELVARQPPGWPDARRIGQIPAPPALPLAMADAHPVHGWRLVAAGRGTFTVDADGGRIVCAPGDVPAADWQRFLVAQALPLAAVLQGLELLHASAVEIGGSAYAFIGPSGAGKTSIALRLALRGATLLTDDVLALAPGERGLHAFPGAALMGVRHAEAARLGPSGLARLGPRVGENAKEVLVAVARRSGRLPLAGVFFLDRSGARRLTLEPAEGLPALLGSVFCPLVLSTERLERALDVAARLQACVPVVRVRVPDGMGARELADELWALAAQLSPRAAA